MSQSRFVVPDSHDHFLRKRYFVSWGLPSYTSRGLATLIGNFACSPFHVVQTLAQVGSKEGRKSYVKIVEDLYRKEGLGAFFRGALLEAFRFVEVVGVNYLIYLGVRKLLADKDGTISSNGHQIANAISIVLSSIITYPLETIRTRLILDWEHKKFSGALDCLQSSVDLDGWMSLFKGSIVSSIGNYFLVSTMERIWSPITIGLAVIPPDLIDASLKSLALTTLYYPIDTLVKMVQAPHAYKRMHPDVECNGIVEAATSTFAKHGLFSLWRGYGIAALQVLPYITVVSLAFAGTTRLLDEPRVVVI